MTCKKRPTQYHHGDLRQALIETAAKVAAREGVEAIVLTSLAKKTGVSGTAPFKHFESREALLEAVAEEGVRRLLERTNAATKGVGDARLAQQLGAMAYVRFAVEEPGYFRVLVRAETQINAGARQAMEALFGALKSAESRRIAQRSAAHLTAQATIYGLARMLVDGLLGDVDGATAERLAHEVTEVLRLGLERTLGHDS